MIARGEFAFLVAYSAQKLVKAGDDGEAEVYMLSKDVYAAVTWGLMWALIAAPFLFKCVGRAPTCMHACIPAAYALHA